MRRILVLFVVFLWACGAGFAQAPAAASFVSGTKDDEAQIMAILKSSDIDEPSLHVAADLDWENAFGIRYTNLAKRDLFYKKYVTPLQKDGTFTRLEVKIKFIEPNVAVADEYWREQGQLNRETQKPGPDRWGRTTYVFTRKDGVWAEVLERVADIRLPYFKHYDSLPPAAKVDTAVLASYAGVYESQAAADFPKGQAVLKVNGDHLEFSTEDLGSEVAIPTSATEFLLMDPNDLAEYLKCVFSKDADGKIIVTYLTFQDKPIGKMAKVQ
jgi:hypothetical protein